MRFIFELNVYCGWRCYSHSFCFAKRRAVFFKGGEITAQGGGPGCDFLRSGGDFWRL